LANTVVIPSDLKEARNVEQAILDQACQAGYAESDTFALKLALEEGLNNAIRHGNRMDPAKTVEVSYDVTPEQVRITIRDCGPGFEPANVPDPTADENLEKPSGRGIMLMRAYMDSVEFNETGNLVCMVKRKG
jgi:serine/threonine-protein kinase RsbW